MAEPSPPSPLPDPKVEAAPEAASAGRLKAQWNRLSASRLGNGARFAYTWRRPLFVGLSASFFVGRYYYAKYQAAKRDHIHPDTFLIWRLYDGAIVEYPSTQTSLNLLLGSSGDGSEPPRVMTLNSAIRTLKFIETDDRITGLIADMSSTNAPSVNNDIPLGLAQIEELQNALYELKAAKAERLGQGKFKTVAFTETFRSQGEYTMASGFDEVYCQPSGEIPLVGINSTVTFYSRLLKWLGIKVHAEARNQYKSMVAPYTQEEFSEPQAENHLELLQDLNDNMLTIIALNRFGSEIPADSKNPDLTMLLDRLKGYTKRGPLMAKEAIDLGLITGTMYKEELLSKAMFGEEPVVIDEVNGELHGRDKMLALKEVLKTRTKGFYHYHKIMERFSEQTNHDGFLNVGVVYVLGTIGDVGEFGTGAIVKGLKEAGDDDEIGAVVLRIDSGGGGVVESDTIWGAVKDLKAKGKVVIASFGNAAASGGYLIATHADSILASPSTITGSIGVASLRPTVTPSFFERIKLTTQSFFTGSSALSLYHELEGEQLARHKAHIDAAYQDFKDRVCDGRKISPELIELLAAGRVYTGLKMWDLNESIDQQALVPSDSESQENKNLAVSKEEVPLSNVEAECDKQAQKVELVETVDGAEKADLAIKMHPAEKGDVGEGLAVAQSTSSVESHERPSSASEDLASPIISSSQLVEAAPPPKEDLSGLQEKVKVDLATSNEPLGRGIIDGIGGIREAAIEGAETYLSRLLSQAQEQNPDKTQAEIMQEVLPGIPYVAHGNGEASMTFDIRLKKFPVHKTFWQQLSEASKRGDSIDGSASSLFSFVRQSFTSWMARSVVRQVEAELSSSFGIKPSDLSELRRVAQKTVKLHDGSSIQAQMHPWSFQ